MPFVTLRKTEANPSLTVHYESWGDPLNPTILLVHELGGTLASLWIEGGKLAV